MATLTTLPTELRLLILRHLVIDGYVEPPELCRKTKSSWTVLQTADDDSKSTQPATRHIDWKFDRPAIMIRNIDAMNFQQCTTLTWPRHRTCYDVRHTWHSVRILSTTYEGVNREDIRPLNAMLYVNRQMYRDATTMLYSTFALDFDKHIEAIPAMLHDMTAFARCNITSLSIVKSPPITDRDYDRYHWAKTMSLLSNQDHGLNSLKHLHIGFTVLLPPAGAFVIKAVPFTVDYFEQAHRDGSMPWLSQLLRIKNLQTVNVYANYEPLKGDMSFAMECEHCNFSASIETSLASFLQREMVVK